MMGIQLMKEEYVDRWEETKETNNENKWNKQEILTPNQHLDKAHLELHNGNQKIKTTI